MEGAQNPQATTLTIIESAVRFNNCYTSASCDVGDDRLGDTGDSGNGSWHDSKFLAARWNYHDGAVCTLDDGPLRGDD
jgi:hypothetical protein